jgi:hypothetical protein
MPVTPVASSLCVAVEAASFGFLSIFERRLFFPPFCLRLPPPFGRPHGSSYNFGPESGPQSAKVCTRRPSCAVLPSAVSRVFSDFARVGLCRGLPTALAATARICRLASSLFLCLRDLSIIAVVGRRRTTVPIRPLLPLSSVSRSSNAERVWMSPIFPSDSRLLDGFPRCSPFGPRR